MIIVLVTYVIKWSRNEEKPNLMFNLVVYCCSLDIYYGEEIWLLKISNYGYKIIIIITIIMCSLFYYTVNNGKNDYYKKTDTHYMYIICI